MRPWELSLKAVHDAHVAADELRNKINMLAHTANRQDFTSRRFSMADMMALRKLTEEYETALLVKQAISTTLAACGLAKSAGEIHNVLVNIKGKDTCCRVNFDKDMRVLSMVPIEQPDGLELTLDPEELWVTWNEKKPDQA